MKLMKHYLIKINEKNMMLRELLEDRLKMLKIKAIVLKIINKDNNNNSIKIRISTIIIFISSNNKIKTKEDFGDKILTIFLIKTLVIINNRKKVKKEFIKFIEINLEELIIKKLKQKILKTLMMILMITLTEDNKNNKIGNKETILTNNFSKTFKTLLTKCKIILNNTKNKNKKQEIIITINTKINLIKQKKNILNRLKLFNKDKKL